MASSNEFAVTLAGFDALRELMGEDGVQELVGLYVEDGGAHIANLATALARSDAALLAEEAHALKGSSAAVGATQVAALCARLETTGRAGTTSGAADLLDALAQEFYRVTDFLASSRPN